MKIINISLIILFYINSIFPQNHWHFLNPLPTGFNLYNINMDSNNKLWVFGEYGTILNSGDNFKTWDSKNLNLTENLYDSEIKDKKIWVIGSNGLILYSSDDGITWATQTSNTNESLVKIQFIDDDHGWIMAADSLILKTDDGGVNWQKINIKDAWPQNDFVFLNMYDGYLLTGYNQWNDPGNGIEGSSEGILYRTTDGGEIWSIADSGMSKFTSIFFLNNKIGYMEVTNFKNGGKLLKTEDSGNNWDTLLYTSTFDWRQINFFDEQNGIAINANYLGKTTNGGKNWQIIDSLNKLSPYSTLTSFITNQQQIYMVGTEGNILESSDLGKNWINLNSGIDFYYANLQGVMFLNSNVGYVYGQQLDGNKSRPILISTNNGGKTWNNIVSPDSGYISILKECDDTIWAACGTKLYTSDDNYMSWKNMLDVSVNNDEQIRDIYLFNNRHIILLAGRRVYGTKNGGKTWSHTPGFDVQFLRKFIKITDNKWIVLGHNAITEPCYKTLDSGITWTPLTHHFSSMQFLNENTGYAIDSSLFKTNNGGDTWELINDSLKSIAYWTSDLYFYNESVGWLNSGDFLYYSKDGGRTWGKEYGIKDIYEFTNSTLSVISDSEAYAVGSDGSIFKLSASGITGIISVNLPTLKDFKLYQNYPNPFNPSTTINYQIPKSGLVTIKIYDVLGREVKTIVNEFKKAGIYKVEFNGFNLASGIYIYTMRAGNFVESKKLILLK